MTLRVLVVCTANRCRSPYVAGLMRHLAGEGLEVRSGGFLRAGESVPREGIKLAAAAGFDLSQHRSHTLSAADTAWADLVVAMTREHLRELVTLDPGVWPRAFTLPQAARRLATNDPHTVTRAWIDQAAASRSRSELIGSLSQDEVADPFGRPMREWKRMGREVDPMVRGLTAALAPAVP